MSTSKSNSKSNSSNGRNSSINPTQTPCCSSRQTVSKMAVCTHLRAIKQQALENFNTIQEYIQACNVRLMDSTKVSIPKCFTCGTYTGRLHICLHCVYIGCWVDHHLQQHFIDSKHYLAVDVSHNQIFCATCNDYVYDTDFDIAVAMAKTKATVAKHNVQGKLFQEISTNFPDPKPEKAFYMEWAPTKQEAENLKRNSKLYLIPSHLLGNALPQNQCINKIKDYEVSIIWETRVL